MLTAVIQASADPADLARTLSSLVPGVAEGLMSHAVVVLGSVDASAERIADAMGASLVIGTGNPWLAGAAEARGEWVLMLEAGEEPVQGWIGVIERHLMLHAPARQTPALLPLNSGMAALGERLSVLMGGRRLRAGLVAPRSRVLAGALNASPLRLPGGRIGRPRGIA